MGYGGKVGEVVGDFISEPLGSRGPNLGEIVGDFVKKPFGSNDFLNDLFPSAAGFALGGPIGGALTSSLGLGIGSTASSILGGALAGGATSSAQGKRFFPGAFLGGMGGWSGGLTGVADGLSRLAGGGLSSGLLPGGTAPLGAGYFGAPVASWELAAPSFGGAVALPVNAVSSGLSTGGLTGGLSSVTDLLKTGANKLLSLPASGLILGGMGLYNMASASGLQDDMMALANRADPFGPQRAQYAAQLQQLMANPSSITSLPGYQAGMDAVQRSMSAQGYQGSGNMMAAMQKYGQDLYNQQVQTLSSLAGAGIDPSAGAKIAGTGLLSAQAMRNSGLGRLAAVL